MSLLHPTSTVAAAFVAYCCLCRTSFTSEAAYNRHRDLSVPAARRVCDLTRSNMHHQARSPP